LFTVFVGGPHFLWCPKNRWNSPLGASVTLKVGKNGLKARKLWPPEVGGLVFTKKNLDQTTHSLFPNPSKSP